MADARGEVIENHCYENFYAGIGMEGDTVNFIQ